MQKAAISIGCALVFISLFASPPAIAASPAAAVDKPSSAIALTIKVTSRSKYVLNTVSRIVDEADRLWRPYGVRLTREAESATRRLNVVIVDDPPAGTFGEGEGERGLGWITFLSPDNPRNVIYLSWKRAVSLFSETTISRQPIEQLPDKVRTAYLGRALGRTLAHEVGHFLLASTEHARSGLMRRSYPARQLFDPTSNGFLLDQERQRLVSLTIARILTGVADGQSAASETAPSVVVRLKRASQDIQQP